MNRISAEEIQRLIEEAEKAGVPDEELQELRDHLADIKSKSPKMLSTAKTEPMYKEFRLDGKRVVRVSTGPMSSDDDFEGIAFKPIKRR